MGNILLSNFEKSLVRFLAGLLILIHFTSALASNHGTKGRLTAQSIIVNRGWNLLSLPVKITDRGSSIFPTAISPAYIYQRGYQTKDTLQNGQGFWLKFRSSDTILVTGETIFEDTMHVRKGWNIIGSLSMPIVLDTIKTDPPGIIISRFFSYVPGVGYQTPDTLQPGQGYWVKVHQDGMIILSFNLPPNAPSNPSPEDSATVISTSPTLTWSCSDPDGDSLTYEVYLGTDNPPATKVDSNLTAAILSCSGLAIDTPYYWQVVASDNQRHSTVGPVWSFIIQWGGDSPCATPTVNYSGKTYNTVRIGSQCWLRENLDVGTRIDGSQNQTDNSVIEKYCYNDDPDSCATYGGLYQWNEAMQYSTTPGAQGICPSGWHIPTLGEFQTLASTVGNDGNALKAVGQGTGGGAGTDFSSFSALLAGCRTYYGYFNSLGSYANFWSSTEYYATFPYYLYLNSVNSAIDLNHYDKNFGFSVRCLKN